ncbi:hypothetical protein MOPEL_001_00100 [Mobilicoccus pelagius NBRC 104925]|uniref:Uncharacterized protein n=2 Tax=Mobilicoccus TaxID=984996 RepID=H5UMD4_9MICO|nr:hypothetical protein MOPEL_001_00100 [Mobilicoccus pelagius NBRC 104925]
MPPCDTLVMASRTSTTTGSSFMPSAGTWWKLLGAAGVAGLVATGALTVRQERRRAAYTPDEIRDRLHRRYEEAEAELARREVVLDSTVTAPRPWNERLDLVLRRHRHQPPPFLARHLPAEPRDQA